MKLLMFYFSGTGNTKAVTKLLENEFIANGSEVTVYSITDSHQDIFIDSFDMIGIGFPIYGFFAPKNVISWLKNLNIKDKKVFVYNTAGGYSSLNNAASNKIIKILKHKNNQVLYERTIVMPSNWFVGYDDKLSKQLYLTAQKKVPHMVSDIINQKKRLNNPSILIKALAYTSSFFEGKVGASFFSISLYANDDCNKCGLCEKNCPVGNIKMSQKINFSYKCLFCMKCIYSCPKKAISSRGFSSCILKDGYNIEKIINDTGLSGDFICEDNKNKYKDMYQYINDISN